MKSNAMKANIDENESYDIYRISNTDGTTVELLGKEEYMGERNLVGQINGNQISDSGIFHFASLTVFFLNTL